MRRVFTILSLIFGLIGGSLLAVGGFLAIATMYFKAHCKTADGVVLNLVEEPSRRALCYRPRVEWTDASGRKREFISRWASHPPAFSRGEHVTVIYEEARPDEARIDSFTDNWLLPLVLAGAGLLFAGAAVAWPHYYNWRQRRINTKAWSLMGHESGPP